MSMIATGRAMTAPPILIAADAGPTAGLGHLARSSALALALRALDVQVSCLALGAHSDLSMGGVNWLAGDIGELISPAARLRIVLDSYDTKRDEVEAVAAFHDDGQAPLRAELIISVGTRPPGPEDWCCGLTYVCLRPPFCGAPRVHVADRAERVLITTGGGDPFGAPAALVDAARDALPGAKLRLVVGPQASGQVPEGVVPIYVPKSIYEEMRAADLIICGAGQTAFEAISLGVPTAVFPLVDNQLPNAERLADAEVAHVLWPGGDSRTQLREIGTDPVLRAAFAERGRRTIDGHGAARVAARIVEALVGVNA